jgi:mycothiol synthase
MNVGFGSQRTAEDVKKEFIDKPQFVPEGLFFVLHDEKPVGSAFGWRDEPNEWKHGKLEMVCVLPDHRGHNLGYYLTLKVLNWFKNNGFEDVELTTDDWRLAAVKQYLRLGFQPVIDDDSAKNRWLQLIKKLNPSGADRPTSAPR